jgi:hypothetical protein
MSIMDMFRTTQTPVPANQGQTPQNPQSGNNGAPMPNTGASQQTAPNGVVPANGTAGQTPGTPGNSDGSPLAKFDDFWQTPSSGGAQPNAGLFGGLDPTKLMDAAKKVDFAKQITPEQLQAISAGGEGAVKAFATAMNSVAQTVYGQSALATTKLVEKAIETVRNEYDAKLPSMLRKVSATDQLASLNPAFASPALQPLTEALTEQFVRKNPGASQQEIQTQVMDYMKGVASVFGTPTQQSSAAPNGNKARSDDTDWEKFFS